MDDERWREILHAFTAARELPASERRAYAQKTVSDPEALEELLAMLDREDTAGSNRGSLFASAGSTARDATDHQEWARLGKTFGRFVLTSPLGRGGMGEVYRARDTELNRTVALKFLSSGDLGNPESVTRFLREAQAASALNHPGVVTIFDVVQDGAGVGIVMELIEGVAMRHICGKPHPSAQVADWGRQVAMALAAAHAAGIVHRDIKPENLMMRPDGVIKVLDFGLARNLSPSGSGSMTSRMGLPVGTIRYMSPEQCRGEAATPASDVFALGITLFELCTGRHPFEADSPLEVAHKIAFENPRPPSVVNPAVPHALSTLIMQMLAKDPAARCPSADLAQKLTPVEEAPGRRRRRLKWYAAAAAIVVVAGFAGWILFGKGNYIEPPLQLLHPLPLTSQQGYESHPAISPDGTAVAFTWAERAGPPKQIWVKRLGEPSAVRLSSVVDGIVASPTWSSDGQRIFFKRTSAVGLGGIMSIASTGGVESRVTDLLVGDPSSALDASPDGRWLAFTDKPGPVSPFNVMVLNLQTGERLQVTHAPEGHWGDWDPKFSPDSRTLAFKRVKGFWQDSLYRVPVSGGEPRQLTFDEQGIAGHAWLQGGRSLLVSCQRGGTTFALWRVPVEPGGQPVLINEGQADLLAPATARRAGTIAWVNQVSDENIYRVSTSGGSAPVRLISSTRQDTQARWAPDGRIAFVSDRAGSLEIWLAQPDGSEQNQVTNFRRGPTGTPDWSADGRRLLTTAYSDGRVVTLDCEPPGLTCGTPKLIPRGLSGEYEPTWSRDGNFIYFSVNERIWREPAAGGQPIQITRYGGELQRESSDGRWLYYAKRLSGIWRTRLPAPSGGADEEERVISLPSEYNPVFALGTTEIFFFKGKSTTEPAGIFACNIAIRRIRRITPASEVHFISVSSDQQQLLYSQLDHSGANVLVANAGDSSH